MDLFNVKSRIGDRALPRALLVPSRVQPFRASSSSRSASAKAAQDVFREGAENCARGGRAPRSISELFAAAFILKVHADVPLVIFQPNDLLLAARPANPQRNWRFCATEHLGGAVL